MDEPTLQELRGYLRALRIQGIALLPHAIPEAHRATVAQLLDQVERSLGDEVEFQLYRDDRRLQVRINGQHVAFDGVGLVMAWLAFAGCQTRGGALRPEWVFAGKSYRASALQARDRAAAAVERVAPTLAVAIRAFGVEGGQWVPKANPGVRVRCTLSDDLAQMFHRLELPA